MTRKTRWVAGGVLTAAVVATGLATGAAQAAPQTAAVQLPDHDADGGDHDVPITGDALSRASAAALAAAGGGSVTETEVGDEEGYYEVEVARPDGSQLDVHLDERFTVLGSVPDNEAG